MKLDWKTIQSSIYQIIDEYKFNPSQVLEIVKLGIKSAFKKDYLSGDRKITFHVNIDKEGNIKIFREYNVAETIEDEDKDILLKDAKKYREDVKIGDAIFVDITPEKLEFSRIAVQAAAQTIKQNLKKIERERFFEKFQDKQGELLRARVLKIIWDNIVLDIEWTTVILAPEWQIPNKVYNTWEEILVLLRQISKWTWWIVLDITQWTTDFLEAIFKKIIPEIEEWVVKVLKISRVPGKRAKVLVESTDERVDPVWVFVGQHGNRITTILGLLDGEKIDFVEKTENVEDMLAQSLKPAKVEKVQIDGKIANVKVADDQKALAIWKGAINLKLASQLLWYRIEVR